MITKVNGTTFNDLTELRDEISALGHLNRVEESKDHYYILFKYDGYAMDTKLAIYLEKEPTNQYDRYAIKVMVNHHKLGYVPKEIAKDIYNQIKEKQLVKYLTVQHYLKDDVNDSYTIEL